MWFYLVVSVLHCVVSFGGRGSPTPRPGVPDTGSPESISFVSLAFQAISRGPLPPGMGARGPQGTPLTVQIRCQSPSYPSDWTPTFRWGAPKALGSLRDCQGRDTSICCERTLCCLHCGSLPVVQLRSWVHPTPSLGGEGGSGGERGTLYCPVVVVSDA